MKNRTGSGSRRSARRRRAAHRPCKPSNRRGSACRCRSRRGASSPDSGSRRKPHGTWKPPMRAVAHLQRNRRNPLRDRHVERARSRREEPATARTRRATRRAPPASSGRPRRPANRRENERIPTRPLMAAPCREEAESARCNACKGGGDGGVPAAAADRRPAFPPALPPPTTLSSSFRRC